jgi:hypothetical protein
MGSVHGHVVLAEELRTLLLGKVPEDHPRIGGVLHRLRGHRD